jgi:decaprenyl-phosphate phosphoribosyltransferase
LKTSGKVLKMHTGKPDTAEITYGRQSTAYVPSKVSINTRAILKLLRVKQWVKNLFIFIPTFFAGDLFNVGILAKLAQGALAFSLIASAVYIMNDYKDRHVDRLHPKKKFRPLASGEVKESTAQVLMAVLIAAGLIWSFYIHWLFFVLLASYFLLNVGYSMGLKNIAILDLFIVAFGFLIRIYSGGVIVDVAITHWLAIMILLLALFLVLAKRRDDLVIQSATGETVRKVCKGYNLEFINSCLTLISAIIIVAYIMYTVSPEVTDRFNSTNLFITTIFVMAGIMRYLQITFVDQDSGSPTNVLYKDKFILGTIAGWIISFYMIIYVV